MSKKRGAKSRSKRAKEKGGESGIPRGGAVVRMYCAGLGDCFLIRFDLGKDVIFNVLIDCGVLMTTAGAREWMRAIAQHIKQTVGSKGIDLLVVTHQHWDHLSGFAQARDIFETIPVRQVWMPWTEEPGNPQAMRIADERQKAIYSIIAAARAMGVVQEGLGATDPKREDLTNALEDVQNLLKFSGYAPAPDRAAALKEQGLQEKDVKRSTCTSKAAADELAMDGGAHPLFGFGVSTDELLDLVRTRVPRAEYPRPGTKPYKLGSGEQVRVYVLGPPTDDEHLRKDDPSKAKGKSEVYFDNDLPLNAYVNLYADTLKKDEKEKLKSAVNEHEAVTPFDRWQRIPLKAKDDDATDETEDIATALRHPDRRFFVKHYLGRKERFANDWRRIDTDWLEAAGQLALNFDNHVNNTSLVLAFELGEKGKGPVLLFPGDAQVGNWLSWHELGKDGSFARSLLAHTVLYKVGHHASHNATLKKLGLQMMTHPHLAAMIPVNRREAHRPKGSNKNGWDMPYRKLLLALKRKVGRRISPADQKPSKEFFSVGPGEVTIKGKKRARRLYMEYVIDPRALKSVDV